MSKTDDLATPQIVNAELFGNFEFNKVEEWEIDEEVETKKEKLDIFLEMEHADLQNKDFYSQLKPSLQKDFSPIVAMRWFSSVPDNSKYKEYNLIMTNEMLNVDFWSLQKHPELQWKLMAMCGCGTKLRHQWIPMPKRKKISKLSEFMLQWYPSANNQELEILTSVNRDDFEQFVKSTGATDTELRDILKAYDSESGIEPEKETKGKGKKRKA